MTNKLIDQGYTVKAFDLPAVAERGKEKAPRAEWFGGNCEYDLGTFFEKEFDVVLAMEVIEHLIDTDQFMRECHRILKDDGILIITTPNVARPYNVMQLLIGTTARGFFHDQEKALHTHFFTFYTLGTALSRNDFINQKFASAGTGNDYNGKVEMMDAEGTPIFTNEEAEQLNNLILKFRKDRHLWNSLIVVVAKKNEMR
jgi:SAM-dependent methyltransferase